MNFIESVFDGYNANPYHNKYHAMDTLQMFYGMLHKIEGHRFLSRLDIFAGLVAALGHDMNHPGVTNAFLTGTRDALALQYNDVSVLENMHCATLYSVLMKDASNVTTFLDRDQWSAMRKTVVRAILSTDMTGHFNMVSETEKFVDLNWHDLQPKVLRDSGEKTVFQQQDNGRFLVDLLMHSSDISNVAKVNNDLCFLPASLLTQLCLTLFCAFPTTPFAAVQHDREVDTACDAGILRARRQRKGAWKQTNGHVRP